MKHCPITKAVEPLWRAESPSNSNSNSSSSSNSSRITAFYGSRRCVVGSERPPPPPTPPPLACLSSP
ncbi:hypothetical protein M0804_007866 [Polistes exclamans]|nr:hypothetical protein M0804_007866 [Polistes exclamans]